ncbi:hypothetical protein [Nannocystis sp. SCPEA4]|uniref:hypothetical protein n=1 Tax=Nannocystis sp. SCPEA4 TaxID=2996787 RepID=UPI00226D6FB4|nr:hypothetical protein [Nannocystis sp. SCPEA4]MCY1061403.1 hypothetical protein [Nannocystis sp. SCPEA4]
MLEQLAHVVMVLAMTVPEGQAPAETATEPALPNSDSPVALLAPVSHSEKMALAIATEERWRALYKWQNAGKPGSFYTFAHESSKRKMRTGIILTAIGGFLFLGGAVTSSVALAKGGEAYPIFFIGTAVAVPGAAMVIPGGILLGRHRGRLKRLDALAADKPPAAGLRLRGVAPLLGSTGVSLSFAF